MTAATVDIRDVQAQWAELLQLVLAGNEVLLTQAQKPVMRLVPVTNGEKARKLSPILKKATNQGLARHFCHAIYVT